MALSLQETKHQVRSLEESVNKYKALVEDKDSTIEYLERKHQDAVQSAEAKLKYNFFHLITTLTRFFSTFTIRIKPFFP